MKLQTCILSLLLTVCGWAYAQVPYTWKTYLSHKSGVGMVSYENTLYCATKGGLFTYDLAENRTETYSTVSGMSDVITTAIAADPAQGRIFVGYEDGTIDYFTEPSNIQTLTDISRNEFFTQKNVSAIAVGGTRLYVATGFGVVIFDKRTLTPIFTVSQIGDAPSKEGVTSVTEFGGRIWLALGEKGLYSASATFANLSDPAAWRTEQKTNGLPQSATYRLLHANGQHLYAVTERSVFRRNAANNIWEADPNFDEAYDHISTQPDGTMLASRITRTRIRRPDGTVQDYTQSDANIREAYLLQNQLFTLDLFNGFNRMTLGDGSVVSLTPNGPGNNSAIRVAAGNGEVYIAPRGYTSGYGPLYNNDGIFYKNADGWQQISAKNELPKQGNRANYSFARASYEDATGTAYLGSWGGGLAVLKEGKLQAFYDCENSGISIAYSNCDTNAVGITRAAGAVMDEKNTLWVAVSYGASPLAGRNAAGEWRQFMGQQYPAAPVIDLLVDDFGTKWMPRYGGGLLIFNDKNTFTNPADDVQFLLAEGSGRGDLPSTAVLSIAKDLDGAIWIGTDNGVGVFYDPSPFQRGKIADASKPIFGTSYLLRYETVNAIAIDGGNRKWFATNTGVYLVSPRGDTLLQRFTIDNSPLLSNKVLHITIDNSTGEVFFATDKGVCSFQGDATTGATACTDVQIFPNPVSLAGQLITIRGTFADSRVRITNVAGQLVRDLPAAGGTVVWDGIDVYGNRVQPGLYFALITTNDGNSSCVGRFSVLQGGLR